MVEESAVPHHYVENLSFGVYSSKEIKALSVKEVTNSQVFDALMHPTFGGLYDQAFGPQERNDVCTTCGLGTLHCPGHMGHITLPLPVYNPVLFKTLFQLLRGTCFTCKRMMVKPVESALFQTQIRLLDHGLVSEAEQLTDIFHGLVNKFGPSMDQEIVSELDNYTQNALKDIGDLIDAKRKANVKHVTESRQQLIKRFIRGDFFSRICDVCRNTKKNLRNEHNTKIFFSYKPESAQKLAAIRKKKEIARKLRLQRQMENPDIDEPDDDEENIDMPDKMNPTDQQYLTPRDAQKHMREVWQKDSKLLHSIMGVFTSHIEQDSCGTDIFFLEVIPVPPSRFRPIARMQDRLFENAQTSNLNKVVTESWIIREILGHIQELLKKDLENPTVNNLNLSQVPETALKEKLQSAWLRLQVSVNCVIDSDLDKIGKDKHPGIKQLLEKKSGLFRKNMMGKRVNFAARSVISPDPYISTNEIGIPLVFAKCLTYPQPVTPWNFQELKQAVINGPDVHPGAVMVENEDGFVTLLKSRDAIQREAIAKQLLTPAPGNKHPGRIKKVYRHLKNGDVLLLNRQPTLHRPSMQAHKARVLPGQKTLRLHYANCKAYNADFDGDEMNAHFPQNEICRAEAYNLACTDYNYLVPKDGTPLAGLIQDHMVSGVKLTMRGRHVTKTEYQQLVYGALTDTPLRIKLLPPCMIKPQVLWSGKQVLSTVLLNVIPEGRVPLNLEGKAKTAGRNWQNKRARPWLAGGKPLVGDDMSESEVVIHQGELLVGVLDKGHYGNTPYGLVHCMYELYGGPVAGKLLTALARLFTTFLQWIGFTLGVSDILVTPKADRRRKKAMRRGARTGNEAAAKAAGVDDPDDEFLLKKRLEEVQFAKDEGEMKDLDLQMKGKTDEIQNEIANCVMPIGLMKRFPENNLQLMVQAGAKGSSVNCMQISCLLGQIELEGRRPPLMLSGQALPSFLAYDTCPRAGGFVDGRFLTGIRPQEYFYHCMAGREGLIDTAVKTSRSGYLQRCIIKHLEGLVVGYDMTVRDSDGSVVQFQYGEDGIDVMRTQFLKKSQFPFLIKNKEVIDCGEKIEEVQEKLGGDKKISLPEYLKCPPKRLKKVVRILRKRFNKWNNIQPKSGKLRISPFLNWCEDHYDQLKDTLEVPGQLDNNGRCQESTLACQKWAELSGNPERERLEKKLEFVSNEPDPFCSILRSDRHFGVTTERFEDIVEQYIKDDPDRLLASDGNHGNIGSEDMGIEPDKLRDMLNLKHIQSLSYPGEAVGLIAAQSIGEPSTQMTLNTFHFAGRGEMNVTLGIPRLREILMVASLHIKTPSMDIPLLDNYHAKKKGKLLQKKFNKVHLGEVLEDVEVTEYLSIENRGSKSRMYQIRFSFLPHEIYKDEFYLTPARVLSYMEKTFFDKMALAIKNRLNEMANSSLLHNSKVKRAKAEEESTTAPAAAEEDTEDILDDDFHDNDAAAQKSRQRQDEELEYEGEEGERDEVEEESDEEVDGEDASTEFIEEDEETIQSRESKLRKLKNNRKSVKEMDQKRISSVLSSVAVVSDYVYDVDEELWCEVTFKFPLSSKKLDMTSLVTAEAGNAVVCQTKGIRRCFLTQSKKLGEEGLTRLKTDGINIIEMFNYQDILDLNQLYSNDIHAVANIYGIEAASRVIIKEVRDVFAAYGIEVDYRHLSLVADYMTFEGTYKSFSRRGIESNASPLQKITFETSMNFLKTATLQGSTDDLKSPSSRLVVGSLVHGGTGAFDIIQT